MQKPTRSPNAARDSQSSAKNGHEPIHEEEALSVLAQSVAYLAESLALLCDVAEDLGEDQQDLEARLLRVERQVASLKAVGEAQQDGLESLLDCIREMYKRPASER